MEVVSFIIGILGTALSAAGIWLTVRCNKIAKKSKTIGWSQFQIAVKEFTKKIKKKDFDPDLIITPGQKGGIIAQLIVDELELTVPICTGFLLPVNSPIYKEKSLNENYFVIKTSKWYVFLPKFIEYTKEQKILIVDDLVMSGDFLHDLTNMLVKLGYCEENIVSYSIATTDVAIMANKAPKYYWRKVEASDSYFPWGKAK